MSSQPVDLKINVNRSGSPGPIKVSEAVGQAVQLLNAERSKAGAPIFGPVQQLMQAAQEHCDDMAKRGYLAPATPEGEQVGGRARRLGYSGRVTALLASGANQLGPLIGRWLASPDYKQVLLDPTYVQLGIGMADGAWTVLLAAPAKAASPQPAAAQPAPAPAPAPASVPAGATPAGSFAETLKPGTPVPAALQAAAASFTPPPAAEPPRGPDIRDVRMKAQDLISRERALRSLPPVALSETLCLAAQAHADDMAARDYFATNSPDGSSAMARAQQRGFGGIIIAALCKGPATPEDAFQAWKDSSYTNLIHPGARYIGVGSAGGRWVLLIGVTA